MDNLIKAISREKWIHAVVWSLFVPLALFTGAKNIQQATVLLSVFFVYSVTRVVLDYKKD